MLFHEGGWIGVDCPCIYARLHQTERRGGLGFKWGAIDIAPYSVRATGVWCIMSRKSLKLGWITAGFPNGSKALRPRNPLLLGFETLSYSIGGVATLQRARSLDAPIAENLTDKTDE